MDEAAAERKGVAPIRPWLARIAGMESKAQLAALVADLQRSVIGVLFGLGSQQDFKDATRQIAFAGQGGMGMPDRDYYLKEDAKSVEQRAAYEAHVKRSFELLGEPPETAAAAAATVLRIETELARAALERVQRREPANVYHPMTLAELQALAPAFDWAAFVAAAGAPAFESLNVSEPDFARALGGLVERSLLADLQAAVSEGDWNGRLPIWKEALRIISERPLLGTGVRGFLTAAYETRSAPHNFMLAIFAELGLVGCALYMGILACAGLAALRQPRHAAAFWLAMLAVWGVNALTHNFEDRKITWLPFGLVAVGARLATLRAAQEGRTGTNPLGKRSDPRVATRAGTLAEKVRPPSRLPAGS